MEMQDQPLVSVPVITYNSSKTVIETLDSIYNQTYQNIELIISDDCSNDNTVFICKDWIAQYKERFTRTRILTTDQNTGPTTNSDRAIKACTGKWVKILAGDDLLTKDCIAGFVDFVQSQPDCQICICDLELFSTEVEISMEHYKRYRHYTEMAMGDLDFQQKEILKSSFLPGPAWFFSKRLFDVMGGYDTSGKYPGEEWTFTTKVLFKNYRFYVVDKKLVKYRISPTSISHQQPNIEDAEQWFYENKRFFNEVQLSKMIQKRMYITAYNRWCRYKKEEALYKYACRGKSYLYLCAKVLFSLLDFPSYKRFVKKLILKDQ